MDLNVASTPMRGIGSQPMTRVMTGVVEASEEENGGRGRRGGEGMGEGVASAREVHWAGGEKAKYNKILQSPVILGMTP